jgi:CRISPR-associated protein Cmr5
MTAEQRRALLAMEHVGAIQLLRPEHRNAYGAMAHKLPALIRSAGLCQALHFVQAKGRTKEPLNLLLDHLAAQAGRVVPDIANRDQLCAAATSTDLRGYLLLTREVLSVAKWYSRLSESRLEVDRGTEAGGP